MTNKEKRIARCTALQVLYGCEIADSSVDSLMELICGENQKEIILKDGNIILGKIKFQNGNQLDIETSIENISINKESIKTINDLYTENVNKYALHLVNQTKNNIIFLNQLICEKSKNWEIGRIAIIDNLILRLAIGEMLYTDEIPLKVSIAEAIEIAKLFSTKDSGRFVNGILDAIYHDINNGKLIVN